MLAAQLVSQHWGQIGLFYIQKLVSPFVATCQISRRKGLPRKKKKVGVWGKQTQVKDKDKEDIWMT